MSKSSVSNSSIEATVDFKANEFNLDFTGQVDEVQMPDIDFGTTDVGAWNLEEVLG